MNHIMVRCRACKFVWKPKTDRDMFVCPKCGRNVLANPKSNIDPLF